MIAGKLKSIYRTTFDRGPLVMISAVGRLILAHFEKSFLKRRYLSRRIHGFRMFLDMEDAGLSRSLLLFRTREVDHKIMLERIVQPNMTIYDIGGNIGYYPLMQLSLLNGSGRMIVVEPSPSNVELLRRNLTLNGHSDVEILQAAVSDTAGSKDFHLSAQSNLGTFHPVGSGSETLTGQVLRVETLTVPILAERFGPPDLIRMDVEGHEVEVLRGILADVKAGRYAPMIIFETHLTRYGLDHDMASVLRSIFALGYTVPLVSSSTDEGAQRIQALGYEPGLRIATDGIHRTLFEDIGQEHAIRIVTETGGIRTMVLSKAPLPKRG